MASAKAHFGFIYTTALLLVMAVGFRPAVGAACTGDCDNDGTVTVSELITGVNIALGTMLASACEAFDSNSDGLVTVNELVAGVGNALCGCEQACPTPIPPTPTTTRIPTLEASPTPTKTPTLAPAGDLSGTWDVTVSDVVDNCDEPGGSETLRVTVIQNSEGRIRVVELPFVDGIVQGNTLHMEYDVEEEGGVAYYDGKLTIAPDFRSFAGEVAWEWVLDDYSCDGIEEFDGVRIR